LSAQSTGDIFRAGQGARAVIRIVGSAAFRWTVPPERTAGRGVCWLGTAPRFDAAQALTREYEERLHAHYLREGYWQG
jgi:hypothetical protein